MVWSNELTVLPHLGIIFSLPFPHSVGVLIVGEGMWSRFSEGSSGSGRFRFPVDPSRFDWLSRSSVLLQTLIGVLFGVAICLADHSCRCLQVYIDDFPIAASTSSCVYKYLLRRGGGPEATSIYAHDTLLVDAGGRRLRCP